MQARPSGGPDLRVVVTIGMILWFVAGIERGIVNQASTVGLLDSALLLAALITVPLQLALLQPRLRPPAETVLGLARTGQPFAAVLLTGSVVIPSGPVAAGLAVPWLVCAGLGFVAGLVHLFGGRPLRPQALLPFLALAYWAVAAAWTLAARAGIQPLGNSPLLVELTAIHFHFAGLGATTLALLTFESATARRGDIAGIAGAAVAVGTPLVAVGRVIIVNATTTGSILVTGGGVVLGLGVIAIAALAAMEVGRHAPFPPRALFVVAAAGVVVSMALAISYAAGPLLGIPFPSLDTMAETHGVINAFVFVLGSTLAWTAVDVPGF